MCTQPRADEITCRCVLNCFQLLEIQVFGVDYLCECFVRTAVLVVDLEPIYVAERISQDAEKRVVLGIELLQIAFAESETGRWEPTFKTIFALDVEG